MYNRVRNMLALTTQVLNVICTLEKYIAKCTFWDTHTNTSNNFQVCWIFFVPFFFSKNICKLFSFFEIHWEFFINLFSLLIKIMLFRLIKYCVNFWKSWVLVVYIYKYCDADAESSKFFSRWRSNKNFSNYNYKRI